MAKGKGKEMPMKQKDMMMKGKMPKGMPMQGKMPKKGCK